MLRQSFILLVAVVLTATGISQVGAAGKTQTWKSYASDNNYYKCMETFGAEDFCATRTAKKLVTPIKNGKLHNSHPTSEPEFSEDRAIYNKNAKIVGYRDHEGIDIGPAYNGTDVRMPSDGKINKVGYTYKGQDRYVEYERTEKFYLGQGKNKIIGSQVKCRDRIMHLQNVKVKPNDNIREGESIAEAIGEGEHVHYEERCGEDMRTDLKDVKKHKKYYRNNQLRNPTNNFNFDGAKPKDSAQHQYKPEPSGFWREFQQQMLAQLQQQNQQAMWANVRRLQQQAAQRKRENELIQARNEWLQQQNQQWLRQQNQQRLQQQNQQRMSGYYNNGCSWHRETSYASLYSYGSRNGEVYYPGRAC